MTDITRYRADTYPERATVKSDGVPVNITGWSFIMTINEQANPGDSVAQVYRSVGEIVTPASDGVVEFPIRGTTPAGTYYYDIESTDAAGKIGTLRKGSITFLQDVTKSDTELLWSAPIEPADGTTAVLDGSVDFTVSPNADEWAGTYETQSGRRVIRITMVDTSMWVGTALLPKGPAFPMKSWSVDAGHGHEWRVVYYVDRMGPVFEVSEGDWWCVFNSALDARYSPPDNGMYWANLWDGEKLVDVASTHPPVDTTGWPQAGWYEAGLRVNADRTCDTLIKQYGDADDWRKITGAWWTNGLEVNPWPYLFIYPNVPADGAHVDLWQYRWRRI